MIEQFVHFAKDNNALLSGIAGILTIIGIILVWLTGFGRAILKWLQNFASVIMAKTFRYTPEIPNKTIHAISSDRNWWHMGSSDGEDTMQIVAYFFLITHLAQPLVVWYKP